MRDTNEYPGVVFIRAGVASWDRELSDCLKYTAPDITVIYIPLFQSHSSEGVLIEGGLREAIQKTRNISFVVTVYPHPPPWTPLLWIVEQLYDEYQRRAEYLSDLKQFAKSVNCKLFVAEIPLLRHTGYSFNELINRIPLKLFGNSINPGSLARQLVYTKWVFDKDETGKTVLITESTESSARRV